MAQENQNISAWIGDDFVITLTVYNIDGDEVNITNLNDALWVLKRHGASETSFVSKTLGAGIAIIDGPGGVLTVTVDAADTADLVPGIYYHEIRIVDSSNLITTIMSGTMTLNQSHPIA